MATKKSLTSFFGTNTRLSPEFRISIRSKGTDPLVFLKTLQHNFGDKALNKDFAGIKNRVLSVTRDYIDANKQRTSEEHDESWRLTKLNNLINTIEWATIIDQGLKNKYRLAFCNKKIMSTYAPYWRKVNYGGKVKAPVMTIGDRQVTGLFGYFGAGDPPSKLRGQVFKNRYTLPDGRQSYLMKPAGGKNVQYFTIPPMYYLEAMVKAFEIEFALLVKEYEQRIKDAINTPSAKVSTIEDTIMSTFTRRE